MTDGDPLLMNLVLLASIGITSFLIILLIIILTLTAVVAGSEVAFFGLSIDQINKLKTQDNKHRKMILHMLERPKKLLATMLIANSFLSIGTIIITNRIINDQFHLQDILVSSLNNPTLASIISIIIQVVLVTFLLVLFGEVLPKVYATQNQLRMSILVAPIMNILFKIFSPFSSLLAKSSAFIEKNIKNKPNEISDEDVEHAIELTVGHSATKEEVNIFKGILKFNEITVKQIMRSRLDVHGIEYNDSFEEVKRKVLEYGYSRLPVYEDDLDNIKGMIHAKDLLPLVDDPKINWHDIIKQAYFVHESKSIEDLRHELQSSRKHMAIVVDEFGGTSGIVTLEDIMEEIIGDIRDEFDEDEATIKKINDTTFICEGKAGINDLTRSLSLPVDAFEEVRGESDTIAGLWLEIAGRFPIIGETVTYKNYSFMVMEMNQYKINKIKVIVEPNS